MFAEKNETSEKKVWVGGFRISYIEKKSLVLNFRQLMKIF